MKALAIAVIWMGYAILVYGADKVAGNCTPFKTVAWPSQVGGNLAVQCSTSSTTPTTGTIPTGAGSGAGLGAAIGAEAPPLPGSGASGTGHPTTINPPNPNGYTIQGQTTPGQKQNPYGLTYTSLP